MISASLNFHFGHKPKTVFFIEVLATWGHTVKGSFWFNAHYYHMGIKNRPYFTTLSKLKLNNSKITHQILTNLTVLENIDKTMFVDHIADILRPPVQTSRQP